MIDISKKYRTRGGRSVRILTTDLKDPVWSVVAAVRWHGKADCEDLYSYTAEGSYHQNSSHDYDLVEVPVWYDFKVDQPVLVRNRGGTWVHRYWAREVDGKPATWASGATEWSSENEEFINIWDECKESAYRGPGM